MNDREQYCEGKIETAQQFEARAEAKMQVWAIRRAPEVVSLSLNGFKTEFKQKIDPDAYNKGLKR